MNVKKDDYVVINSDYGIGVVTEVLNDPSGYTVLSRGVEHNLRPEDITPLSSVQVEALNYALRLVSEVIDRYHEEELYGPVYNEEGRIIYSSSADAVLRALAFPALLLELTKAGERIVELERKISELGAD